MAPTLTLSEIESTFDPDRSLTQQANSFDVVCKEYSASSSDTAPPATEASAVEFRKQLTHYFETKGRAQKELRPKLAHHITRSTEAKRRVSEVLERVSHQPSQGNMLAAQDLLFLASEIVPTCAIDAGSRQQMDDNAAFALASAALAVDGRLWRVLLRSKNVGMREAVIERLPDIASEQARPPLMRISQHDPDPMLQQLAAEALEELDED